MFAIHIYIYIYVCLPCVKCVCTPTAHSCQIFVYVYVCVCVRAFVRAWLCVIRTPGANAAKARSEHFGSTSSTYKAYMPPHVHHPARSFASGTAIHVYI